MKQLLLLAYYVGQVVLLLVAMLVFLLAPPALLARALRYVWNPHPGPIGSIVTGMIAIGWVVAVALIAGWFATRGRRPSK